ncbi:7TM domain-containing protein [Candidatus Vampirococcus lugosii]|uniref:7 transmembrane helices usually fused to an inactive transglutaminase domain-containing protein n=1 Tax=Candidatus Vampirococcus lugosii TaxID=2789015 RepID=A0ABS5QNW7_9BACT|nr:7TM domain-containing protein [Candidatus Vampirococcus lugosii]MBS8122089.1 hypothetical protein [Candidatus Vampirococcus lugosii]
MKKFFIFLFLYFTLFFSNSYSQENLQIGENFSTGSILNRDDIQNFNVGMNCIENKYKISGEENIKYNSYSDYTVKANEEIKLFTPVDGFMHIYKNGKEVYSTNGFSVNYDFPEIGEYEIFSYVEDAQGCSYEIWQKINSYKDIYTYIGDDIQQLSLIQNTFTQRNIYLEKIFIPQKNFFLEDDFFSVILENTANISDSSIIIINNANFSSIFEFLGKFSNIYKIDLSEKDFFLITDQNTNFIKRTLAQYINKIGLKNINILSSGDILNLFDDISQDNFRVYEKEYLQTFSISFEDSDKQYFLSYVVDVLLSNDFPIHLIGIILTLSTSVLVVTIFRQIIGFSVFGVYNPILFAISMLVLGINLTFILLFVGLLSTLVVRLFTQKIYLLYSAKISLLMIIYFILSFIVFWIDNEFGFYFIDYSIFTNSFIMFPLVFMIMVSNKIFSENFVLFSKSWFISFIEFLIVSSVVYTIITLSEFEFFILAYPDFILLILIINILVGRFTGLQLLEYIRFMPLLKNKGEEE